MYACVVCVECIGGAVFRMSSAANERAVIAHIAARICTGARVDVFCRPSVQSKRNIAEAMALDPRRFRKTLVEIGTTCLVDNRHNSNNMP